VIVKIVFCILCREAKSARFDFAAAVSDRVPRVQPKRPEHFGERVLRRAGRLLGHAEGAGACGNESPRAQPQGPRPQSSLDELQVGHRVFLSKQRRTSIKSLKLQN